MMNTSPVLIAQITDTHLFAESQETLLGVPTAESLSAVIEQIQTFNPQPDRLLLTGDLSQDETLASYQQLYRTIQPLNIPTYWVPGNHDEPELMETVLTTPPIYGDKSFQCGGWQFLLLNSRVAGKVSGHLSQESLSWLDAQLQQTNLPTLVALHHPPFVVNANWLDQSRLQNSEQLFKVLDHYPQVQLVLFGHIHQDFRRDRAGVTYLASPSSSVQFKPHCDQFTLDEIEPGFRLLWLYPDGTFETNVKRTAFHYTLDLAATGY